MNPLLNQRGQRSGANIIFIFITAKDPYREREYNIHHAFTGHNANSILLFRCILDKFGGLGKAERQQSLVLCIRFYI